MTRKQQDCLAFIAKYIEEHGGESPSMEEIMLGVGLRSKSGAARLVEALEAHGLIRRTRGRARGIQLIDPGEVKLNPEIFQLVHSYAKGHEIAVDTAANELLRQVLGAAA